MIAQTHRADWAMTRTIAPIERIVTVQEVKRAIRLSLDDNFHDSQIVSLIDGATSQVEHDCSLALMRQTYGMYRDCWPRESFIYLPVRPLLEIQSIKYTDGTGVVVTMPDTDYKADRGQPVILRKTNAWPAGTDIEILFDAGFGDDPQNIPAQLKQAVMLQVGKWFQNPTMDMNEIITGEDKAYERLIARWMRGDLP